MNRSVQLIIPAAGLGTRLGRPTPKALVPIAGVPLLVRTLTVFARLNLFESAIVLCPIGHRQDFAAILASAFPAATFTVADGGAERQDSIRIGLDHTTENTELVVLHDAARPFVTPETIEHVIAAASDHGGATVAVPSADTILESDSAGMLVATPDRDRLWACETPQVFRLPSFREAHKQAQLDGKVFTDDATLYRAYGGNVKIVHGSAGNRKITTEADLNFAEFRFGADH